MSPQYREEVLNVCLARRLAERGLVSLPEQIITQDRRRRLPDVFIVFRGLRTVIEGKRADSPQAATRVQNDARSRVEEGLAHIGIAVLYPPELRSAANLTDLEEQLERIQLRVSVFSEAEEQGWVEASIDTIADLLRRTHELLSSENVVALAVEAIEEGVNHFSEAIMNLPAAVRRNAEALGIRDANTQVKLTAVSKISGLTILNAMVFQEVLSGQEPRVNSLHSILEAEDVTASFISQWDFILTEIDYVPIFRVAKELLEGLPADRDIEESLIFMGRKALSIVNRRTALRHDLMGRVYHRLLVEAKYLGTYYTSIPAATLLLKLSLTPNSWGTNWSDLDNISSFKVADLACGTGTLLMAAADSIKDNYVNACSAEGVQPQVDGLHRRLVEDVIHGYDVLPSALHLTASTLALTATDVTFDLTNLYSLPLGGDQYRLGSIEFLNNREIPISQDLFGAGLAADRVSGSSGALEQVASLPELDLCVMNPPFTRSVGNNLLFGSVPEAERTVMRRTLAQMLRSERVPVLANSTAGLGSVFTAVGDRHIRRGGRIALVLPKTLLSGVAWEKTRALLGSGYKLEYLIVSNDPERWNFSDNTDLSEMLLVAQKRDGEITENQTITCVNLWKNPVNTFESLAVAQQLIESEAPSIIDGQGSLELYLGETKFGEAITINQGSVSATSWMLPCAFAQSELIRVSHHLLNGELYLPGQPEQQSIPLAELQTLGTLGPDRRDIYDGFQVSGGRSTYPALWGHDSETCQCLALEPNEYLAPLNEASPGRHLRRVADLWPRSGNIVIAERLRINTQRLVAAHLDRSVLSNVWWPFKFADEEETMEKVLVLWLNSTLGLITLFATREETEGAWISLKKPKLAAMPVLNVRNINTQSINQLSEFYDEISHEILLPISQIADDPVRRAIDERLATSLSLPDISIIRELLSHEPIVCLCPLY